MESNEEKLNRLEMMTGKHSKWDLSSNDIAAIEYALERIDLLEKSINIACRRGLDIGKDELLELAKNF